MSDLTPHNETIVDQHTQQAEAYAKLTRTVIREDRRAVLRTLIGLKPDDRVLDVACGPGFIALDLAPYVADVTGIDITPAMLDEAREAQQGFGIDNAQWVLGDAIALPFPDASFSVVTSGAAFHHFEEPARVLAEMVRVCRPGGRIAVIDVAPEASKTADYDRMELMRDPSHGHAHSLEEIGAMGVSLGLRDPVTRTSLSGPLDYAAVLATSHPEGHSREELLAIMREDAEGGADRLGFRAEIGGQGEVMVTYPMAMTCWTRA